MAVTIRTCVACRLPRERSRLVRLVGRCGQVQVDPTGRQPGRGAYVCRRRECLDAALRRGGAQLRRALRLQADPAAVDVRAVSKQWSQVVGILGRPGDKGVGSPTRQGTSGQLPDGSE